jgi:hypothetical protein
MTSGPVLKHTPLRSQPTNTLDEHVPTENLMTLYGYSDADWDMDIRHQGSISGMVFFLAGAVVAWKARVQPTVALSTPESDFLAESETGILGVSSEPYSPNSFSLNIQQRKSTKTMMHAEWSPTRPHPLVKCVISVSVILRSKTGPNITL